MLTELCCVFANFGSADQQLERPAEPATPPRNDQIVDAALGRCHLRRRNIAMFLRNCTCLGRELRTRSLSIPRHRAGPRITGICEGFLSAKLGGVWAKLQS